MKNFLAAVDFLSILPYIIVAVMLILFVIIVVIAVKKRNKPKEYVPDEIDRTVDEAAHKKERQITENEDNSSVTDKSEQPVVDPVYAQENETSVDEDEDEEITFEVDDVETDEGSDSSETNLTETDGNDAIQNETAAPQQKEDAPKRKISYRILYDKESKTWEIRKDNAKRVIRRVKTKKEALEIAQELSKNQDLNLVVHKKDGKFQKKENWSRNLPNVDNEGK